MKFHRFVLAITLSLTALFSCMAAAPPMPGMTSSSGDSGMKHVLVSQTGIVLSAHVDSLPASTPVVMMSHQQNYEPSKFDVLEDVYFNAQYRWLPDGFFSLPAGRQSGSRRSSVTPTCWLLYVQGV